MGYMEQFAERIRKRKPFESGQVRAYLTKGGTYIIASPALLNDDNRDHDLMAITVHGQLLKLRSNVDESEVRAILNEELAGKYPEHFKLMALDGRNQAIGDFITWLREEKGWVLASWGTESDGDDEEHDELFPTHASIEQIIAEYFGINRKKLEDEKSAMLDGMRAGSVG